MTNKEMNETKLNKEKKATEIANELAQDAGFADAKTLIGETSKNMKNGNTVQKNKAVKLAGEWASNLVLLLLYQEIENPSGLEYIESLGDLFDDGVISEGNGKQYIIDAITGSENFVITDFVPKTISNPSVNAKYIAMYEKDNSGNVSLTNNAYQYKKTLTIQESLWVPYFMAGKLREFIESITATVIKSYAIYKFSLLAELISTLNPTTKIVGTATDMFKSLSTEIFPVVEDMLMFNEKYSYDATNNNVPSGLAKEDLRLVCSLRNRAMLRTGIMSQLFNAKLIDLESNLSGDKSVISLGDKIVYPTTDSSARVSVSNTPYVDDNTIFIFDKNLIKHLSQINRNESQAYSNNLTIQLTLHMWGVIDTVPWRKCVKYTNPNLNKLPE